MNTLPPLPEWLAKNTDEITEIIEFTKSHVDPSPEQLNQAGAEINQKSAVVGYLLADAEAYLVESKAFAMADMDEDMGPTAQKVYIENMTKDIRRLRDNLRVACRSLKSLSISVCSVRKSQR